MFTFCFFLCFDYIRLYLVKQENCSMQAEKTCPSSLFILRRHYRHIFTAIYRFHKINSSRHNNSMAFEICITMLIHNKDDIPFVTEFPCFLGHPVLYSVHTLFPLTTVCKGSGQLEHGWNPLR